MKKKYLVIGGSSGIGLSLINKLLKEEHQVFVISRQEHSLPKHPELIFFSHDVTKMPLPSIQDPLDGFVYLPGTITLKPFSSLKKEDLLHDFEINVLAAFESISFYLPNLKKTHSSIVLMSSIAATKGFSFHASIASAKAAVEGLTRSLAAELAPVIRVNAVAPSLTQTPLSTSILTSKERMEMLAKKHPLQRLGSPDDISNMICYLLSESSSWITGQVFHVDGGFSSLSI